MYVRRVNLGVQNASSVTGHSEIHRLMDEPNASENVLNTNAKCFDEKCIELEMQLRFLKIKNSNKIYKYNERFDRPQILLFV